MKYYHKKPLTLLYLQKSMLKNSLNRSNTACRALKCHKSQVKDLGVASILNLKETNLWPVLRKKWKRESSLCVWDRLLFCVFYFVFVAGSKVRKKRMSSSLWGPRAEKKGEAIKKPGGNRAQISSEVSIGSPTLSNRS